MKPFPIRVERAEPITKFIEWALHNVCTYDCSFCGDDNKDGSIRWKSLDEYKMYVDKIMAACAGEPVYVMLTGGEPTLFPKLINLYQYIRKNKNAYLGLTSNGTRSIRWWKEFRDTRSLDRIILSYHSEQTADYQKIIEIASLFHDEPVEIYLCITHVPKSVDLAFEALEAFKKNTGALINMNGMMVTNNEDHKYTPEQLKKYTGISWTPGALNSTKKKPILPISQRQQVKITHNDGSITFSTADIMIKHKEHVFTGWDCHIGNNVMRIMGDSIWRGMCREGGPTHSFADPIINFTTGTIKCTQARCGCPSDLIQIKTRPDDLVPDKYIYFEKTK